MVKEKRYLVGVGMSGLPFPIRVFSRSDPAGQHTVAEISVEAQLLQEFEASWIDTLIRILHGHRENIGTATLKRNIFEYKRQLNARSVKVTFTYPLFVEKTTPVSNEKCLVKYDCAYRAKTPTIDDVEISMRISVPCITTYPASDAAVPGGLLGQLSVMDIEIGATQEIYPEELVESVDKHAVSPVYSFMTREDQQFVIERVHSIRRTSVVVVDDIKRELAADERISFYSVKCRNFGMLHSYNTTLATEMSWWVPYGADDEI